MKRICLCLYFSVAIVSGCLAQADSIYAYYDLTWQKLADSKDAGYFRVVKNRPDGKYLVRDYYMSGNLQFVGICTALEPKLKIEGEATLYHESGAVEERGQFEDEKPVGLHRYFYEDGSPHKVIFHRPGEKDIYHQFWSREGEAKLVKGTGLAVEYFPGRPAQYYEIKDSVAVAVFADDESGNTIYMMVEQIPEYRGGYEAMMRDLQSVMKYPKSARRRGIQGTVYVSFVIGKNGEVSNVRILKGIQDECDREAVRAVSTLNKWTPGMHHGQPVFVRFVLPIKFTLKGWSLF